MTIYQNNAKPSKGGVAGGVLLVLYLGVGLLIVGIIWVSIAIGKTNKALKNQKNRNL